jgi:alpha-beta hydrolase superfamily lysophospholipase
MQPIKWRSVDGCTLAGFMAEPAGEVKAVACLVHGLGEHAGRYRDVTGVLTGAGIALFSLDLRGHGLSDGKRGHAAPRSMILADVDALIRHARETHPGVPVFLYGHSLGGNIVLSHRLFGKEQVAGTVSTSPWLILAKPLPSAQVAFMRLLGKIVPGLTINNGLDPNGLSSQIQVVEDYRNDPLVHPFVSVQTGLDAMDMARIILERASENHGPVLGLHGGADPICSIEGSRRFAEKAGLQCTFREWPGMRHELHHEVIWPEVAQAIADFIMAKC